MTEPQFKGIAGFHERYLISSAGDLYTKFGYAEHIGGMKRMCPFSNNGYLQIPITDLAGRRRHVFIHRLVALAFIPNPLNLPEVDHIDSNPKNNDVSNLQWISHRDNVRKAYNWTPKPPKPKKRKLTDLDVVQIRNSELPATDLVKKYKVTLAYIYRIRNNIARTGRPMRHRRKLSDNDVVAIRASKENKHVLAARYNVCAATIYNIRANLTRTKL